MQQNGLLRNILKTLEWRGVRQIKRSFKTYLSALLCLLAITIVSLIIIRQTTATAQEASRGAGDSIAIRPLNESQIPPTDQVSPETQSDARESVENPGQSDLWTNAPTYPILIFDNVVVSISNTLYSFTGASFGSIVTNSYKFNGTTWTPIAPVPAGLSKPAAVTDGTSAYIIGGSLGGGSTVNTLYRYNPATNNYTTLAPSIYASFAPAAAYLNGKIYKIGGYTGDGQPSNTVEVYDIASNQWVALSNYPLSVGWAAAWSQGNFVYVAGGAGNSPGSDTEKTYRYDPATDTWDDAAIADLPDGRWGSALGVDNGFAILAGGGVGDISDVNFSRTVVVWNPNNNTWEILPNLLRARARVAGAVINGNFYVVGGSTLGNTFTGSTTVQQTNLTVTEISGTAAVISPSGGILNPGNTVTVDLILQNSGLPDSGNIVATLLATGGISNPSAPQTYETVPGRGGTVSRRFTFQIPSSAVCGSQITLSFQIQEGSNSPVIVTQAYALGARSFALSENFDAVTAPALPARWTSSQSGTGAGWETTDVGAFSFPNAAMTPGRPGIGLSELESPAIPITTSNAQISFDNVHSNFPGQSGAVLEISIPSVNGGAFQDILAAGGTAVSGGYNGQLSVNTQNPLRGRPAWTGFSGENITSLFNLPTAAGGQSVRFKWRLGTDNQSTDLGIRIDDVKIIEGAVCSVQNFRTSFDFDGDGKADVSVFRPSNSAWYLQRSLQGFSSVQFGAVSDILTPADFDGDGKTDVAVFRPSNGVWYIINSSDGTVAIKQFGSAGDLPRPADYDGDGRADTAVWRPATGSWFRVNSSDNQFVVTQFGLSGDLPQAADFDGDGRADVNVYRPSTGFWYRLNSSNGQFIARQFGANGDFPVAADYDGDGRADIAVWRPGNGTWYRINSSNGQFVSQQWGLSTDLPAPADYDGDGKTDYGIFRNGNWYLLQSNTGFLLTQFGFPSDKPISTSFIQP